MPHTLACSGHADGEKGWEAYTNPHPCMQRALPMRKAQTCVEVRLSRTCSGHATCVRRRHASGTPYPSMQRALTQKACPPACQCPLDATTGLMALMKRCARKNQCQHISMRCAGTLRQPVRTCVPNGYSSTSKQPISMRSAQLAMVLPVPQVGRTPQSLPSNTYRPSMTPMRRRNVLPCASTPATSID